MASRVFPPSAASALILAACSSSSVMSNDTSTNAGAGRSAIGVGGSAGAVPTNSTTNQTTPVARGGGEGSAGDRALALGTGGMGGLSSVPLTSGGVSNGTAASVTGTSAAGGVGIPGSTGIGGVGGVLLGGGTTAASGGTSATASVGTNGAGMGGTTKATTCTVSSQTLYMVFLFDKSGSMGDATGVENSASRWAPMKQGLLDFLGSPGGGNTMASLRFFPANGDKATTCHADYKTPTVEMTRVGNATPFATAFDTTTPNGGTPTLPAMMGGIALAKQIMTTDPNGRAVVVLITDGEPGIYNPTLGVIDTDCAPEGVSLTNTIADIARVVDAAYKGTPSISTYVLGIGEAHDAMATIAFAGGTDYVLFDTGSAPETNRAKLKSVLDGIRAEHTCTPP